MNIFIMSRGRAGKTNTQNWIPEEWRHRTIFVVPNKEVEDYGRQTGHKFRIWPAAEWVSNYSEKFQWIMDGLPDKSGLRADPWTKCLIVDDDLVFSSRSDPSRPNSLISIRNGSGTAGLWERIESTLDQFPLVGVHPRAMGQNAPRPYTVNGRVICMQGINRDYTRGIRVNQFPILADVILNCTLLSRGLPNALLTTFFQDHGPCQAPGGCSIYRTADMQRDAVLYLAGRFKGFIKPVERRYKTATGMGEVRHEFTGRWKDLYSAGVKWKNGCGASPDLENEYTPEELMHGTNYGLRS